MIFASDIGLQALQVLSGIMVARDVSIVVIPGLYIYSFLIPCVSQS
jgi:hypothetical protein